MTLVFAYVHFCPGECALRLQHANEWTFFANCSGSCSMRRTLEPVHTRGVWVPGCIFCMRTELCLLTDILLTYEGDYRLSLFTFIFCFTCGLHLAVNATRQEFGAKVQVKQ